MPELSAQSVDELRTQLNAAIAQPAAAPATIAAAGVPPDFCTAYKTARPILQTAASILPIVLPGLGTTIAAAITAIITVCDKVCPPT